MISGQAHGGSMNPSRELKTSQDAHAQPPPDKPEKMSVVKTTEQPQQKSRYPHVYGQHWQTTHK
tara:strand:- start:363 stop:554 length:192 start_codon:yes stop_codon:yes gene_type:complete